MTNLVYTYDSSWKDLLTKIGTGTVSSDGSGNILNDGTHTYTWTRGSLLLAEKHGTAWQRYFYDAGGILAAITYGGAKFMYKSYALFRCKQHPQCWRPSNYRTIVLRSHAACPIRYIGRHLCQHNVCLCAGWRTYTA